MAKKSHQVGSVNEEWQILNRELFNLSMSGVAAGLLLTALIGPPGLLVSFAGLGFSITRTTKFWLNERARKSATYLLPNQSPQNLTKLRAQLKGKDALIVHYRSQGKHCEAFMSDGASLSDIPDSMILSFAELQRRATRDENNDMVAVFFGRPL